jgi:iron only hydrogenase large subunit-like protein
MQSFVKNASEDLEKYIKAETVFDLSLNNCLACSGCITDDIGILSVNLSFVNDFTTKKSFVISSKSKINIFYVYRRDCMGYQTFEMLLSAFLKSRLNISKIAYRSYI